jgi:hypothetical protein
MSTIGSSKATSAAIERSGAVVLADHLQAMRHALEGAHRRPHRGPLDPGRVGGRARRQDVGQVVPTAQRNLARRQQRLAQEHELLAGQVGALDGPLQREPKHASTRLVALRPGVVGVEDCPVRRRLVVEDLALGRPVLLHGWVAVQVVRRDVCDQGNVRAPAQRLELKAGKLHHHPARRAHLLELAQQRPPDVAAHEHVAPGGAEDLAFQSGGGALAGRAGDAQDRRRAQGEEQLDQAAQPDAAPTGFGQQHMVGRNARRGVHHVDISNISDAVTTQAILDLSSKVRHRLDQLLGRLLIRHAHTGPMREEKPRQVQPLARQANHQGTLASQQLTSPVGQGKLIADC